MRRFGDLVAVDGLDLKIARGQFYGLLGRNGAGKSTTVAMLTGLLRPTAGTIRLLGCELDSDPAIKGRIGVVTEEPSLFTRLRGGEQLRFSAQMYGLSPAEAASRADELLALLELDSAAKALVADYSRGMRKKLALACALIHGPELLFLDEPFEGVDAISARTIQHVLSALTERGGATVLLTTHILDVAQRLCARVGIIDGGKLRHETSVAELEQQGLTLGELFAQTVGRGELPPLPDWLRQRRTD